MPEMKNSFQKGRMNKDLDERMVPQGEYRDALNVEVSTSESSNIGTLQTIKGNIFIGNQGDQPWAEASSSCVGSIANEKNDKLYFFIGGNNRDYIIEYDYHANPPNQFSPVCVDIHGGSGNGPLNFSKASAGQSETDLITGINIIDDTLFWTDNKSEPKRINITRGKQGSNNAGIADYLTTTRVMVKDPLNSSVYIEVIDNITGLVLLTQEKDLTVIKKGPSTAPVLEMIDTQRDDNDGDGDFGGYESRRAVELDSSTPVWLGATGEIVTEVNIAIGSDLDGDGTGSDFIAGDILIIYPSKDPTIKVRVLIDSVLSTSIGSGDIFSCTILSGDIKIAVENDFIAQVEEPGALFEFKLPRFACRYKYEDGEYSAFSPFTEPAFIPGPFNYMGREGYNLGMVNKLRKLVIKNFVHTRTLPPDVVSIDILYKESNSTNVYSVKSIKRKPHNNSKWDEWNAISPSQVVGGPTSSGAGFLNLTKGYLPITSEIIHAALPSNQLLRPWDNVPRMAVSYTHLTLPTNREV